MLQNASLLASIVLTSFDHCCMYTFNSFRKQQVYDCDELSPFVQSCVDRFEKLPSPVIAETVIKFLAQ